MNLIYSIKQGIKGFFASKTMSTISIISVTSSLIILGIILSMFLNVNNVIQVTKDEVNEIRVMIDENASDDTVSALQEQIKSTKGVKSVEYKSKEDLFEEMKVSMGEDNNLLEGIDNPLEDNYIVTIENPDTIKSISSQIVTMEGVSDTEYYEDIITNFITVSDSIKKFGSILIICLLLTCLAIIGNTIKGRVHSKKEEIKVLKYVGASDGFVIAPFIIEGVIIGILGAIIALIICLSMYGYIMSKTSLVGISILSDMVLPLSNVALPIILVLSITGVSIGILGSLISVRKYIRV